MPVPPEPAEDVVLLAPDGTPVGTAPKETVHTATTPLHLAFSCYAVGERGVLLTRRALTKHTWPGVWTNAFCGHPQPGESPGAAVARRAWAELGVGVRDLELVLPDFRYRAIDPSGVVENEVCPVFIAHLDAEPDPAPAEVMQSAWVRPAVLVRAVADAPFAFSPWMVLQVPLLREHLQAG